MKLQYLLKLLLIDGSTVDEHHSGDPIHLYFKKAAMVDGVLQFEVPQDEQREIRRLNAAHRPVGIILSIDRGRRLILACPTWKILSGRFSLSWKNTKRFWVDLVPPFQGVDCLTVNSKVFDGAFVDGRAGTTASGVLKSANFTIFVANQ